MTKLSLKNISYSYNTDLPAIKNFSLDVEDGSFTTLLGPSGCGKTTLLKLIAGFIEPDKGEIEIEGKNQKGIAANKRQVGMVFQDYALFPHMTVKNNILYGIKIAGKKQESYIDIKDLTSALNIENFLDRYPNELSGGQQQRVALARALILNPKILLMDEPLSSLDSKLREHVREELKEIQQRLKITTIYVTHDQDEALSLSDKIAVIKNGFLLQTGSPKEIYYYPKDNFTADFVGRANFINGKLIRPEWFSLSDKDNYDIKGTLLSSLFLGSKTRFIIKLSDGKTLTADISDLDFLSRDFSIGECIYLSIKHYVKM